MKHILIDFENVQPNPEQFSQLNEQECHIWLFLGLHQQKTLALELCEALCRFGKHVHFIRLSRAGKNALDFHLAYYLGKITQQDHEAEICILSRDGGYDVLVEHLAANKLCMDIFRLSQLQQVNNPTPIAPAPIVPTPSQEPFSAHERWLHRHKFIHALNSNFSLRKRSCNNLLLIFIQILQEELSTLDREAQLEYGITTIEHLKEKGFIQVDSHNLFLYTLDQKNLAMARLKVFLENNKPKQLESLKNVIISICRSFYLTPVEKDVQQFIQILENQKIIFQQNKKILYQPPNSNSTLNASTFTTLKNLLVKNHRNRPNSYKSLCNMVQSHLKLSSQEAESFIVEMQKKKYLQINSNNKITYHL